MNELISVIVPVYKVEKYLDRCVQSIVEQTYTNLEIILIDDGSPDRCPQMCDEWAKKDKRIKVVHKENGGVSKARNVGLKISNGEVLSFVDSDDFIQKDFYEHLYYDMIKYKADIVCCNCRELLNGYDNQNIGSFCLVKQKRIMDDVSMYYQDFGYNKEWYFSVVWGKIIKRSLLRTQKFEELSYGEDTLYMMKLFNECPITYLDDYIGYNYIRWNDSVTIKADTDKGSCYLKRQNDQIQMILAVLNISKELHDKNIEKLINIRLIEKIYDTLYFLIKNNKYDEYVNIATSIKKQLKGILKSPYLTLKRRIQFTLYVININLYWKLRYRE